MKPKVKVVNARKKCKLQDILPPLETLNKESNQEESIDGLSVEISDQIENGPNEDMSVYNVLLVGDLVWSRIPGHCWWPSMVSYDPNSAVYFEKGKGGNNNRGLKFHVQFFGDEPMRGWVSKTNILRFEGGVHYSNLPLSVLGNKNRTPQSNRKESWENAVKQAENALLLERRERKLTCMYNYNSDQGIKSKKKKQSTKNKQKKIEKKLPTNPVRRSSRTKSTENAIEIKNEVEPLSVDDTASNTTNISITTTGSNEITNIEIKKEVIEEIPHDILLEDLKQPLIEQNNNNPVANLPVENSSDSGIEDIADILDEELNPALLQEEVVPLKRKRKQKVFEDFHTGSALEIAIKYKTYVDKASSKKIVSQVMRDSAISSAESTDSSNESVTDLEKENLSLKTENGRRRRSRKSQLKQENMLKITSNMIEKQEIPQKPKPVKRKAVNVPENTKSQKLQISDTAEKPKTNATVNMNVCNTAKNKDTAAAACVKQKIDTKDQFCALCEESNGELLLCSGVCLNSFHLDCLGIACKPKKDFTCDECLTGVHSCFVCKLAGDIVKCSQVNCGKFYHVACVKKYPETKFDGKTGNKFYCPHHFCKCCYRQEKSHGNNTAKKIKCIRCPTAYHQTTCFVAGCGVVTPQNMICDNHFEVTPKSKNQSHINVTWCFVCSIGGSLICCDTCPASFHVECIDNGPSSPDSLWQCKDCKDHKKVKYGDIVWIKFGVYKWWPGKICLPEQVPDKILKLPHSLSQFPVMFFGSRDYAWLHAGRVFRYEEGDTGGSLPGSNRLAAHFQKALSEAAEHYKERKQEIDLQEQAVDKRKSNKPPAYKHLKTNRPITCIRTVLDPSEWPVCECTASEACGGDSECLNRMLLFECNPKKCPAGEACQNQRMLKYQHANVQPFKCEGRGWGLKAKQGKTGNVEYEEKHVSRRWCICSDIKNGDFVIEYVGELIDEDTCRKRIQHYHDNNISDYYFLTIDRDNIIDAYPKGNLSRFMNHSCDPNCETQKWTVNGEVRVGLFANRDILTGDELCFNYNLDCLGNDKKQCKCGSANCSGFLGVPPKTQHSLDLAEKAKNKKTVKVKRKRKTKVMKVVHEDECFICGDGGELILCARQKCIKSYHTECLNMEKKPHGKWDCPWHFCDGCGKPAKIMCSICPNSFCTSHRENNVVEIIPEYFICIDHPVSEHEKIRQELQIKQTNLQKDNKKDECKSSIDKIAAVAPPAAKKRKKSIDNGDKNGVLQKKIKNRGQPSDETITKVEKKSAKSSVKSHVGKSLSKAKKKTESAKKSKKPSKVAKGTTKITKIKAKKNTSKTSKTCEIKINNLNKTNS